MKLEKIGLVISDYDLERGDEFIGLKIRCAIESFKKKTDATMLVLSPLESDFRIRIRKPDADCVPIMQFDKDGEVVK